MYSLASRSKRASNMSLQNWCGQLALAIAHRATLCLCLLIHFELNIEKAGSLLAATAWVGAQEDALSATRHIRHRRKSSGSLRTLHSSWQQRVSLMTLTPSNAPAAVLQVSALCHTAVLLLSVIARQGNAKNMYHTSASRHFTARSAVISYC